MFSRRCTLFPEAAPAGGLLIVDDAEKVLADGNQQRLRDHLDSPGSKLLLACRNNDCYNAFAGGPEKPVHVQLPPLNAAEATDLFLRRCHRPLQAADLSPPSELDSEPTQVVDKRKAFQILCSRINVLDGDPVKVRLAGDAVRPGSPCVQGNLGRLVSG